VEEDPSDRHKAIRGLAIGMVFGILLWAIIILVIAVLCSNRDCVAQTWVRGRWAYLADRGRSKSLI